ncbi:MAG: hypothetical protein ABSF82_11355 [Candidatus Bathyarchaeia archaeon]
MRTSTFPAIYLLILLFVSGTLMTAAAVDPSREFGGVFYFHYGSQLYRNQNASITLLEEANLTSPVGVTPQVVEVASDIRNATSVFGSIWVGTVAWVTQPLVQSTSIQGPVVFAVWLSSDDSAPSFSGVGAGIAILNQQNETVGDYDYTYSYAEGSILTPTPKEYDFTVDWNRHVDTDQRLVFAVGVGSTMEGWRMKVYYGAAEYPSHTQLPISMLVIPEFTQPIMLLTVVCAIVVTFGAAQRESNRYGDESQCSGASLNVK